MHLYYFVIWIAMGIIHGRLNHHVGGWLIMITDSRNTFNTWMTFPSLILCWVFWPIGGWLAQQLFMTCRFMDAIYLHYSDRKSKG